MNENLANILNITPETVIEPDVPRETDEWDYAKQNIIKAIAMGNVALEEMVSISKQSQHPAAYEVLTALLKEVIVGSKTLMDAKRVNQQITNDNGQSSAPQITQNNLFVGTTAEIAKIIEAKRKEGPQNA